MGDNWITDFEHIDGANHPFALFLTLLVKASYPAESGFLYQTKISCRRRPERTPCTGEILIRRADALPNEPVKKEELLWVCPKCDDQGTISNFAKSRVFESAANARTLIPLGELFLNQKEFDLLKELTQTRPPLHEFLMNQTKPVLDALVFNGTCEQLKLLEGRLTRCNQFGSKEDQEMLADLLERVEDDLAVIEDLVVNPTSLSSFN